MTSSNSIPSLLVGKGAVVPASYRDPLISSYRDNPLIEALPDILPEEEAMTLLARYPSYDESERQLPSHLRLHLVQNALQFVETLPVHLDLEQRFSRMIRVGYQARNPLTAEFQRDFQKRLDALSFDGFPQNRPRSTATGFTIIGISGVGKTTAVEVILSLYPQVIVHSHYRSRDFTLMQIVWLKLDCPFDGSIKGLCLNFFQAVDDLLGTNYSKNYTRGRLTVDELLPNMARVASLHCIGVLVIDEIQHLSEAKSGGSSKMLNFFVQMVNTIGLPVVLVGTYKAMSVLSGEFRQVRRGSGQGDLVWDRMTKDDGVWELFVESLWRYQYVRKSCPVRSELSDVLYDVTQGITDFAVKVYMLAQIRAITTGKEAVTESIIRSVATDSLRLAQPILKALKTGETGILHSVEDVHPINITSFLQEAHKSTQVVGKLRSLPIIATTLVGGEIEQAKAEPQHQTPDFPAKNPALTPTNISTPLKTEVQNRQNKSRKTALEKDSLVKIVSLGAELGIAAYEALKQADYIRPATEYLLADMAR